MLDRRRGNLLPTTAFHNFPGIQTPDFEMFYLLCNKMEN